MEQSHSKSITYTAASVCILIAVALAGWWIWEIRQKLIEAKAREALIESVAEYDARAVVASLEILDPNGTGSATDWTGEPGLEGLPGFNWLLQLWREGGQARGLDVIFRHWGSVNPGNADIALLAHLRWSVTLDDTTVSEGLFELALERAASRVNFGPDTMMPDLFAIARDDSALALTMWEHLAAGSGEPPAPLVRASLSLANFSDARGFDRLLQLTKIPAPAEDFHVTRPPISFRNHRDWSWIEEIHEILATPAPEVAAARTRFLEGEPAGAGPDHPGLFLLRRLLNESGEQSHPELVAKELIAALDEFSRLTTGAREDIAALIGRNVRSFRGHDRLRQWVWDNHGASWQEEGEQLLALTYWEKTGPWTPDRFSAWVRRGTAMGQAGQTAIVAKHVWKLQLEARLSAGFSAIYDQHPFSMAPPRKWTADKTLATTLTHEPFSLLLALGKDPQIPPNATFPDLKQMLFWYSPGSKAESAVNPPWREASAESFLEMVTDLGEPFAEDPLRFLIVPCFEDFGSNFSETLSKPSEVARFQELAARDTRPGSWLAKDLAELLPRWWIETREEHDDLLNAGGHTYSFNRMEAYLSKSETPVGARVSYALACLNWHMMSAMANYSERIGSGQSYFPDMTPLALEFAREFNSERWSGAMIDESTWELIVEEWLGDSAQPLTKPSIESRRKEARGLLINKLGGESLTFLETMPCLSEEEKNTELDRARKRLGIYAKLLRLERRTQDLGQLLDAVSEHTTTPRDVFPWVPFDIKDEEGIRAHLLTDPFLTAFRQGGWTLARERLGRPLKAEDYKILTEVTALLDLGEWIELCAGAFDLMAEEGSSTPDAARVFYALPPSNFLRKTNSLSRELRVEKLLTELEGVDIAAEHEAFFSLALPVTLRQITGITQSAPTILRDLEGRNKAGISAVIGRTLMCAADRTGKSVEKAHLDAMRNPRIPLAQRWLAANYFLIARSEDIRTYERRKEEWRPEDWRMMETAGDLLVAAIDAELPVWNSVKRGLGGLHQRGWSHTYAALNGFLKIQRFDPKGQSLRAALLLDETRIRAMLVGSHDRLRVLHSLHSIARFADNQAMVVDLYTEAEPKLSFEEKLSWLNHDDTEAVLATLLKREWRALGEAESPFVMTLLYSRANRLLPMFPEGSDLRRLMTIALSPRPATVLLPGARPRMASGAELKMAAEFVEHRFESPEMERIALDQLPIRAEDIPGLESWLDARLVSTTLPEFLKGSSNSIRSGWPYWSRRIHLHAGTSDFEKISKMLPEPQWFRGHSRPFDDDGWRNDGKDSVEEMVWMTFARAVTGTLRYGGDRERLDAGAIAARLLASLPLDPGGAPNLPKQSEPRRPTTFYDSAAAELAMHAVAGTLMATLADPPEVALARVDKFHVETSAATSSLKISLSAQEFFRLLAEHGETLTESQRRELFLRASETRPFNDGSPIPRPLPWFRIGINQLPSGISHRYLVDLAKARLEAGPVNALHLADLGLVHHLAGEDEKARPFLEKARAQLAPEIYADARVLDEVNGYLAVIASGMR